MNGECGPRAASQITAGKRDQNQATTSPRHQLAVARANALVVDLVAAADGIFEPTQTVLDALAGLAVSLAFDLRAA